MIRKPIAEYGFSRVQLEEIQKFFKYLFETQNSSDESIEGVRYFIDKSNFFYVSYALKKKYADGVETQLKYLAITPQGTTELNKHYDNLGDIVKRFEKYAEIELV